MLEFILFFFVVLSDLGVFLYFFMDGLLVIVGLIMFLVLNMYY